jgi:molybdopterin synthase catalytic subunit
MVALTVEKISIDHLLAQVEDHSTGGVVLFLGRVRNHAEGRPVIEMDYEAYPDMAVQQMQTIEAETRQRWPGCKIAIVHRTGHLLLGDVSVAIAVASAHRETAFAACRFVIDTLKAKVPIWKKEYFADGEAWVQGVIPERGPSNEA